MRIRLKRDIPIAKAHGLVKGMELEANHHASTRRRQDYYAVVSPRTHAVCRVWPEECEVIEEVEGGAREEDRSVE